KTFNDTMDTLINNTGIIEAMRDEEKDGKIVFTSNAGNLNTGTLKTKLFQEKGATFKSTGTLDGGRDAHYYYDNLDGAANISGTINANQSDTGNLDVVGNVTLGAD